MFRRVCIAVEFALFDDLFICRNNCRVVCLYQWNVIVNGFFSMCEQGSSVYFVYFIPLFKNNLNRVAYVHKRVTSSLLCLVKSFMSEHILLYLRSCEKII